MNPETENSSILASLSSQQRGAIKEQLRAGPKLPSQIVLDGLDPLNPQHRELVVRYIADLAEAGEAKMIYGQNTDAYGRAQRPQMLGWKIT